MSPPSWIRQTFLAAAAFNVVGITIFTRGFTNDYLMSLDPGLFSRSGCLLIVIWGLAYGALSGSFHRAPWVALVFAIEKLFYGISWVAWLAGERPTLAVVAATDPVTAAFYGGYGAGDLAFGAFFLYVFLRYRPRT